MTAKRMHSTMANFRRTAASIAILVSAALLLLPSTLFYLAAMFFVLLGAFAEGKGGPNVFYLSIAALLLVPGYGLYSAWWLAAKHRQAELKIPMFVWAGIAVGSFAFLSLGGFGMLRALITPQVLSWDAERMHNVSSLGGGPLLFVLIFMCVKRPWGRSCRSET